MWFAAIAVVVLAFGVIAALVSGRNEGPQNYLGDVTARWRRR